MQYEAIHGAFWTTGTFWVTVAVVAFLIAFGGKILRAITSMLDARGNAIRATLEEAQLLRRQAEEMLRDAERRQAEAIAMATEITAKAQSRAARMAADLARDAAAAQARREIVVTERILAAQTAAVAEVRQAAAKLAVDAVSRVIAENFDAGQDAAAIDAAIEALPGKLGPAQPGARRAA